MGSGGGIGVSYELKNLPAMLPGLILCIFLGWLALQWDHTMSEYRRAYGEAKNILKPFQELGKPIPTYEEYKAKKEDAYKGAMTLFQMGIEKKKPSKPYMLQKEDYDYVATNKDIPTKFVLGERVNQFQLTYVAVLLLGGMLIRNTVGVPKIFQAGTVAARPLIKPGIIILGAYYMWSDVLKVGAIGLFLVVLFVLGTQIMISVWGRRSNVDDGLSGLMGAGVGVCGVSAAVAAAPVVNAKPRDFFYAIGTILLFGTLCLFTFPYIGKALGMSQPIFGAWCGTAILNTAQLVAAASWYGHEALLTANIINIVRVGFIPIIVMWAIYYYVIRPAKQATGEAQKLNAWQVIKEKFPIFVFGFFIMVTLNEAGFFTKDQARILGSDLLKIWFAIGFAGVGLNIAFDDLRKAGGKAFVIGFSSALLKAVLSAAVIMAIGEEVFKVKG
ncbi:MAG: putative sulfate exporter family transporter [Thermodesulfovibrionales bacterium]|nr:putative sulfate exporter family transporter [Thermodesulfovibrionales bacterium]